MQIDFYIDSSLLKTDENGDQAYDSTSALANHAVTIGGWDDNYSVNNFMTGNRPQNNGAWLVKNSWGSNSTRGIIELMPTKVFIVLILAETVR